MADSIPGVETINAAIGKKNAPQRGDKSAKSCLGGGQVPSTPLPSLNLPSLNLPRISSHTIPHIFPKSGNS